MWIGETQANRGETAEFCTSNCRFNLEEQGNGRIVTIGKVVRDVGRQDTVQGDRKGG